MGVGLHGERDSLGDERVGDLRETGVLGTDEVGSRDADVLIRQFCGVEASQPILSSLRVTVNPGVPFSTTSSETPPAPAPPVRTAVTTKSARTRKVMKVFDR